VYTFLIFTWVLHFSPISSCLISTTLIIFSQVYELSCSALGLYNVPSLLSLPSFRSLSTLFSNTSTMWEWKTKFHIHTKQVKLLF
jgi:type III secretory pathway component EscR